MREESEAPSNDDEAAQQRGLEESGLMRYEPWLRLLARMQTGKRLQGKFDASDVAQQTMIEAWKALPQFRGTSEGERIAWLRQILARVLGQEVRRYRGTQKRDVSREMSLNQALEQSSCNLAGLIADGGPSPSENAVNREEQLRLAEVLERLSPDYREVIIRRNLNGESHDDIAKAMGRKPANIRMMWVRALRKLRKEMELIEEEEEE